MVAAWDGTTVADQTKVDDVAERIMVIEDLTETEQAVLGGLVRLMVRTDGSFSEEEEQAINDIGDTLGGKASMWRVISQSAQSYPNEADIRGHVKSISRPEVRTLLLEALARIAASDSTDAAEDALISWVREQWS